MTDQINHLGYRKLWCAVMLMAFEDLRKRSAVHMTKAWFESKDFQEVCHALGLEGEQIRRVALAKVAPRVARTARASHYLPRPTTTKRRDNNTAVQ